MPTRGSRASAACLFCREKKLKCDSQRPTCGNCLVKGVDCQQGAIRHKPRPTNHRIAQLEQENASLRQQCLQLQQRGDAAAAERVPLQNKSPPAMVSAATRPSSSPGDFSSSRGRGTSHSEAPDTYGTPNSAAPLYQGPTSTAYDDIASLETGEEAERQPNAPASEEWTRQYLFAQTARQRQLEPLNLASGKLDFDGLDPELGMHLLAIYWSRQLYTAQIIYRPLFMRDMACGGPYFSKLLLNAILYTCSRHCPRPEICSEPDDITTAGMRFRQRFTELLRDSFDKSDITTIQALLIMSNSLFARCDERSLSWLYAGNAFNMIIDLGLHVLPRTDKVSAEELEARKRVLWGAYSVDKIQCLFQGRPPLLRRINFKASLNFLDEYDELDAFRDITYRSVRAGPVIPSLNVSLLTKLCELSTIAERILCELYSESQELSHAQSQKISEEVHSDLSRWRQSLPPRLDYFSQPGGEFVMLPQSLCLVALWNVLIILSQRPLFTGTGDRGRNPALVYEPVNVCTAAANHIVQILREYSKHFSVSSSPHMLSYATYISATIHARIVAQTGRNSRSFQSLLLCRSVLEEYEKLYATTRKAKGNLDRLIAHLGIDVEGSQAVSVVDGAHSSEEERVAMSGPTAAAAAATTTTTSIDLSDQTLELGSTQANWDWSDLDLEAIAQGFRLDGELHYLLNPGGI